MILKVYSYVPILSSCFFALIVAAPLVLTPEFPIPKALSKIFDESPLEELPCCIIVADKLKALSVAITLKTSLPYGGPNITIVFLRIADSPGSR